MEHVNKLEPKLQNESGHFPLNSNANDPSVQLSPSPMMMFRVSILTPYYDNGGHITNGICFSFQNVGNWLTPL